jgi:hypothetical protein
VAVPKEIGRIFDCDKNRVCLITCDTLLPERKLARTIALYYIMCAALTQPHQSKGSVAKRIERGCNPSPPIPDDKISTSTSSIRLTSRLCCAPPHQLQSLVYFQELTMDNFSAPLRRKLVIVGDGACGKTSLLMYLNPRFLARSLPS